MKLRRLLMASALALSFTVTVPTVAKADPISAAVVAFVGFTGTAAAVATFVINSALYAAGSWAVSKAAQALGLNKNAVQERQAQVTTLTLGESPRELVVGEACTGGTLVDAWNWGGKYGTDYVTRCIALADHLVDRLVGYYVDDQYYSFTTNGNQAAFGGALRLIFVNATADGSNPPADVGASNGGWTNADKVVGVTHVWVVTKVDDKVWTQGHPRFKFVLRGLKAYDPRRDPALGYSGPNPQTWDNPASHTFTRNAALLDYAYDRGIYATGRQGQDGQLLIGRGLSAEEAPPERIISAANLCDEIVDGEARYTANGVISAAQPFLEVKQAFASAMAGIIIQPDGGVAIEPGQAKAVVATITDGDLVAGEAKSFSEFLPDTDGGRVNTVVPRYVEPSQGYKDHSGAVRRDLAHLAVDGGPRELTLPLLLVTSAKQADRCAEITRLKARLERRATIVLPPDYAEVEEGDWIAWQSARHHAGATVRYRVTSWSLGEDWRQHLTLEEIASSVYGVPDPAPDVTNPPPPPVPVDALELFGVIAEAVTLAGETSAVPAVRFRWDPVDDAVVQIRAEVRKAGETAAASLVTDDVAAGELVMTNGVTPDQLLECRLTPIAASSTRPVVPTNWSTVSTSTIRAGEAGEADNAGGLGGFPASELLSRLATTEAIGASNSAAVDDLEEVFGDTVSAAESALAAGQAAQLAQLKAGEAGGAATAANTSAGIASTKATEAGNSATAANASKLAAEAARNTADDRATASVTSAAQAAASATAAGQSATASEGSATQAATRAGEALTYRNQASDARDGAVTAQIGAGVSASTAQGAVRDSLVTPPISSAAVVNYFTTNLTGSPESIVTLPGSRFTTTTDGAALTISETTEFIRTKGVITPYAGQKIRLTARVKKTVAAAANLQFYIRSLDASFSTILGNRLVNKAITGNNVVQTLTADFDLDALGDSGSPFIRFGLGISQTVPCYVLDFRWDDVTSEIASATSAAASLSQAASATASAASASLNANLAVSAAMGAALAPPFTSQTAITKYWSEDFAGSPDTVSDLANGRTVQTTEGWAIFLNASGQYVRAKGVLTPRPGQKIRLYAKVKKTVASAASLQFITRGMDNAWAAVGSNTVVERAIQGNNQVQTLSADFDMDAWLAAGATTVMVRFSLNVAQPVYVTGFWWEDITTTGGLDAQLQVTAAVAADAQSRLATAAFEVLAASGGDPAQLLVKTQGSTSLVQMVASALRFCNVFGGTVIDVMKLISGSVYITGKLLLGAAGQIELDPSYPLILWKIGTARLAIGQIPNDNLFLWFGGNVAVGSMRKNNATVWFDRAGSSYWGGSIFAGTLSNSGQGTNTQAPVEVVVGPFATNGGPIVVAYSYSYVRGGQRWGNQTGAITGTTTATLRLYRKIGTAAETLIATQSVEGTFGAQFDGENQPGQPAGTNGQTLFNESMGGSWTYTDNAGGLGDRTYRWAVEARTTRNVPGNSSSNDNVVQRYGVTTSE